MVLATPMVKPLNKITLMHSTVAPEVAIVLVSLGTLYLGCFRIIETCGLVK